VLSLEPAKKLIVVKHGDIKGFMPAMTMPYEVKDQRLLDGLAPGDLIKATLVVLDNGAYLSDITKTGQAPIEKPPAAAAAPAASSGLGVYTGNAWTPEQVLADLKSGG
jgi:protein SCO1/2